MKDIVEAYNSSAEEYAQSRAGTEDTVGLQKLRSYLPAKAKILDVGCAAGRDTRILKDMGLDAVGTDLADKLLEIARRENPDIPFVLADMRKLPFADQSFDAVWASAVLHHVRKAEMADVLQEFWRILSPNGLLYIHTKAGKGLLRTQEASVKQHERTFELVSSEELDTMLAKAGYSKLSMELRASKSRKGLSWVSALYRKIPG